MRDANMLQNLQPKPVRFSPRTQAQLSDRARKLKSGQRPAIKMLVLHARCLTARAADIKWPTAVPIHTGRHGRPSSQKAMSEHAAGTARPGYESAISAADRLAFMAAMPAYSGQMAEQPSEALPYLTDDAMRCGASANEVRTPLQGSVVRSTVFSGQTLAEPSEARPCMMDCAMRRMSSDTSPEARVQCNAMQCGTVMRGCKEQKHCRSEHGTSDSHLPLEVCRRVLPALSWMQLCAGKQLCPAMHQACAAASVCLLHRVAAAP